MDASVGGGGGGWGSLGGGGGHGLRGGGLSGKGEQTITYEG